MAGIAPSRVSAPTAGWRNRPATFERIAVFMGMGDSRVIRKSRGRDGETLDSDRQCLRGGLGFSFREQGLDLVGAVLGQRVLEKQHDADEAEDRRVPHVPKTEPGNGRPRL